MKYILFITYSLVLTSSVFAQPEFRQVKSDSAKLGISSANLNKMISTYVDSIFAEKITHYSDSQYIEMIRIYNTIFTPFKNPSKNDTLFHDHFINVILAKAVEDLNFVITRGLGYYSRRYNIHIGGSPNANSRFVILNED